MTNLDSKHVDALKTFAFFLLGFYIIVAVHELTHGFIAAQYCENVWYNWIPNTESLAATHYSSCSNMADLNFLQNIVEIVGYQLLAFYCAIISFVVLYTQKIRY